MTDNPSDKFPPETSTQHAQFMEMFKRSQEVEKISKALADALAGLDATPDMIANGIGQFVTRVLVGTAVKYGHNPEEAVERWCLMMKQSAAEKHREMLALGLKEPL